jgi:hypothetical protein
VAAMVARRPQLGRGGGGAGVTGLARNSARRRPGARGCSPRAAAAPSPARPRWRCGAGAGGEPELVDAGRTRGRGALRLGRARAAPWLPATSPRSGRSSGLLAKGGGAERDRGSQRRSSVVRSPRLHALHLKDEGFPPREDTNQRTENRGVEVRRARG